MCSRRQTKATAKVKTWKTEKDQNQTYEDFLIKFEMRNMQTVTQTNSSSDTIEKNWGSLKTQP